MNLPTLHLGWKCTHCNTDSLQMLISLAVMQIAKWEAADALFNLDADLFSNTLKLRQAGYEGARLDTKTNFYERLEEMADRFVTASHSAALAVMHPVQQQADVQALIARQLPSAKHSLQPGQSIAARLPPWSVYDTLYTRSSL